MSLVLSDTERAAPCIGWDGGGSDRSACSVVPTRRTRKKGGDRSGGGTHREECTTGAALGFCQETVLLARPVLKYVSDAPNSADQFAVLWMAFDLAT